MTLHRVGYGGMTKDEFMAQIKALKPDLVIDARYSAYSRNSDFSGNRIGESMKAAGIEYAHWKGLGNTNYRGPGPINIASPEDVDRVHELAKTRKIVLVCVCKTSDKGCHTNAIFNKSSGETSRML
jgi:hypothetical protein